MFVYLKRDTPSVFLLRCKTNYFEEKLERRLQIDRMSSFTYFLNII